MQENSKPENSPSAGASKPREWRVTKHPTMGHEIYHLFAAKADARGLEWLVKEGLLYKVSCDEKPPKGMVSVGCEDDAHAYSNRGLMTRVEDAIAKRGA